MTETPGRFPRSFFATLQKLNALALSGIWRALITRARQMRKRRPICWNPARSSQQERSRDDLRSYLSDTAVAQRHANRRILLQYALDGPLPACLIDLTATPVRHR
jgi:hypothetical protein